MTLARLAALALAVLGAAAAAPACEMAGPDTHLGTVMAVDAAQGTLTIRDAQTRVNLTFLAAPGLLQGLAVRDEVAVVYAKDGERLRATAVRKKVGG
jgi:hypothetical protein